MSTDKFCNRLFSDPVRSGYVLIVFLVKFSLTLKGTTNA